MGKPTDTLENHPTHPLAEGDELKTHTPGPWFYERDFDYYLIETGDGHTVVKGKDNTEGNEADYRLIAAAPDLLEALKPFAAMAPAYDPEEGDDAQEAWAYNARPTIGQLRAARAAISRTKGQDSE